MAHLVRVAFSYEYPRPAVTVDTILATADESGDLLVLLIERRDEPFASTWALPGGFIDEHEDLEDAARREMLEETQVELGPMIQIGAYGTPHRDPRGHTVGVAFLAICGPDEVRPQAGDDAADCRWFKAKDPPKLAFDHSAILGDARAMLQRIAIDQDEFQRTFAGQQSPEWIGRVRTAARDQR